MYASLQHENCGVAKCIKIFSNDIGENQILKKIGSLKLYLYLKYRCCTRR